MKFKAFLPGLVVLSIFVISVSSCSSDEGYNSDEPAYNDGGAGYNDGSGGDGGYGDGGSSQNVVQMTVDNDGVEAFYVRSISGNEQPTSTNVNNSTWTLSEGTRYELTIVNSGSHPFQVRSSSSEILLSQNSEGTFESESAVNFVDDDEKFYFTLTAKLADEISAYFCGIHSNSMTGNININ